MDKSIENIWKEGFLKVNTEAAPRVENLYRRKSLMLTEKFKRTLSIDNWSILPLSVCFLIGIGLKVNWGFGIYVFAMMILLFFYNRRCLKTFNSLHIEDNVHEYMRGYLRSVESLIRRISRMMVVGFPAFIVPAYIYIFFVWKDKGSVFLEEKGWTIFILLCLAVVVGLSALGWISYRVSVRIVYGRMIKDLRQMVADMDDLSQE